MFRREYYPSDTIKIVNQSEGKLGTTGKAAHAIAEHLMKGSPGAVSYDMARSQAEGGVQMNSAGIGASAFLDRFKEAPGTANSGWLGKGDMAVMLCEVLNSEVGQEALGALDGGVQRVEVHYLNEKKLAKAFGGLGGVGMKQSLWTLTPATSVMVTKTAVNKKGETVSYKAKQTTPKSVDGAVKALDLTTIHAVLDGIDGRLHLQTLFPDNNTVESHAKWRLGTGTMTVTIGTNGKPVSKLTT